MVHWRITFTLLTVNDVTGKDPFEGQILRGRSEVSFISKDNLKL